MITLWAHFIGIVLIFAAVIRHGLNEDRRLTFYTKNKGRTFWYKGREMKPSKLTELLKEAHSKHTAYEWSKVKWINDDFYDDNA
jgi:hypothetical protein